MSVCSSFHIDQILLRLQGKQKIGNEQARPKAMDRNFQLIRAHKLIEWVRGTDFVNVRGWGAITESQQQHQHHCLLATQASWRPAASNHCLSATQAAL